MTSASVASASFASAQDLITRYITLVAFSFPPGTFEVSYTIFAKSFFVSRCLLFIQLWRVSFLSGQFSVFIFCDNLKVFPVNRYCFYLSGHFSVY